MADPRANMDRTLESSLERLFAITPHDTNDLANVTTGLYVGVTGDVAVILAGDSAEVTLVGLAAGIWHPMRVRRVLDTGTDADSIVGGY